MTQTRFEDLPYKIEESKDLLSTLERISGGSKIVLVRDMWGRCRFFIDTAYDEKNMKEDLSHIADCMEDICGAFAGSPSVIFRESLPLPEEFFRDSKRYRRIAGGRIFFVERGVMGESWNPCDVETVKSEPKRVVFWGMKGGVGRSSALCAVAWHMSSRKDQDVLVFDLDLESPGITSFLLPPDRLPDYGIVDWFVEDAVGQADESFVRQIFSESPIATGNGRVYVVPAYGKKTGSYLPKLNRSYLSVHPNERWTDRMVRMIKDVESNLKPDFSLFDSRAGLQDISAATITQLGATPLLFAIDTPQTWKGYEHLLSYWKEWANSPDEEIYRKLSENLFTEMKVVASMVPDTGREEYLAEFREKSYSLFQDNIYREADTGHEFNFDLEDESSPHFPLEINWSRGMMAFDPLNEREPLENPYFKASFEAFLEKLWDWVGP